MSPVRPPRRSQSIGGTITGSGDVSDHGDRIGKWHRTRSLPRLVFSGLHCRCRWRGPAHGSTTVASGGVTINAGANLMIKSTNDASLAVSAIGFTTDLVGDGRYCRDRLRQCSNHGGGRERVSNKRRAEISRSSRPIPMTSVFATAVARPAANRVLRSPITRIQPTRRPHSAPMSARVRCGCRVRSPLKPIR